MNLLKPLSSFLVAVSVFAFATPAVSAANFSEPKVASVYAKISLNTDRKIAKIRGISAENRIKIVAARENLKNAFLALDAAFKRSDSERQRAVNRLVRAYSDLNLLIRISNLASPSTQTASQTSDSPSSSAVSPSLSAEAQILYYADMFEGRGTANGDRFSQSTYSAARCAIDLGRLIQVSAGSKSVVVKANDRPNCTVHPDIVDLSKIAFEALAPLSKGRLSGSFEPLGITPAGYRKELVAQNVLADLGVRFDENLPNTYFPGETLLVSWTVTDGKDDTVLFLKSPSGKKFSRSIPVSSGRFSYRVPLFETGKYDLVVASGMGFSTTKTQPIYVLPESAVVGKRALSEFSTPIQMGAPEFVREESSDLTPINVLKLPKTGARILWTVKISQPGIEPLVRRSMGDVAFEVSDAARFDSSKPVRVSISAAESSTPFSMDTFSTEKTVFDAEMPLAPSYVVEKKEAVTVSVSGSEAIVRTNLASGGPNLRTEAYLMAPNGDVTPHVFPSSETGADGYVAKGRSATLRIPLSDPGQYLVEVMYSNGFPAYNGPIVHQSGVASILPNEYDSMGKDTDSDVSVAPQNALRFINAIRKKAGKPALVLDSNLERLARFKAEDMAENNYVGHDDSAGAKINGTAKRAGIEIGSSLGENVAGGSVWSDFLLAGLSLSGGHRMNMLGDWTKLGIAAVVRNGMTYYVQIFAE